MNRIFGTTNKKPKPTLQDAIAATDTRIAGIEVKVKKLDGELSRYKEQMAKMKSGPGKTAIQNRALQTLKQKRMYESQLAGLQQQTFNMESAAMTTDNLRNTMATVDAMQTANKELRRQYGKVDIDKIESVHYDMEDLLEQANEIQEMMGRSYGVPEEVDEAELEAAISELEALSAQLEEDETPSYLQDVGRAPDFVDETPVEESATPAKPEAAKTTAYSAS
ncbi:Snf7, partial [Rhizoctonia solani]